MAGVITAFRDLDRLREIAVVLTRHGFGEVLQRLGLDTLAPRAPGGEITEEQKPGTLARRIRLVLQDLGPSFVKLGQIGSTRADVLPPEVIEELKVLQDDVKPVAWAEIRSEIEAELGSDPSEIFAYIDEKPLASASIAQVHRGRYVNSEGEHEVAIKVQRPRIRDTVSRDVDLLYWLARALERTLPETRRYSPVDLVAEFDRSIHAELDFGQEAEHAERFAKNFEGNAKIRFPRVHRAVSGKRVLTLEFLSGKRIEAAIASGTDGSLLAKMAVGLVIKMVFEDGFFHADPHPGNMLILGPPESPVIGLFDLGLVGHLSGPMRDKILDLVVAVAREDFDAVADSLYGLGRPTRKVDMPVFRADVATKGRRYVGRKMGDIEVSALVRDFMWGAVKHGIDMPADFMLMGRALATLEGTGRQLQPDLDVLSEARPYVLQLVARRYSPDKLTGDLVRQALKLSGVAGQMPEQIAEVLDDLRKGHLTLKSSDPLMPLTLDRLGRRVFTSLLCSSLLLGGSVVLSLAHGYLSLLGGVMIALAALSVTAHILLDWWRTLGLRR